MSAASRRAFLAGGTGAAAWAGAAAGAARRQEQARVVPLLSTYAAGVGRHAPVSAYARLRPGELLALRREPENDWDRRAVSVWTPRGEKLGYVPRVENQALANLMDAGLRPEARVARVAPKGPRPELRLDIALPLDR